MKKNKKYSKGTTVVELLIYLALLTIFLTVLLDIFVTTLNFKLQAESSSSINQDARYILSKLSYDVYNADSVTIPSALGATASSLQLTNSGITVTYSLDADGNILITKNGVTMKLNGIDTKIQNISFKKLGNAGEKPTIQIIFTLQSLIDLPSGIKTQSVQTTLGLR